jgi:hypothetical protein
MSGMTVSVILIPEPTITGSTALGGPWPLFQFLNLYTVGRTSWTGGSARRKSDT